MNLSRKIVLFNLTLLTLVATLGGISLWNVSTLWRAPPVRLQRVADYDVMDRAPAPKPSTQVGIGLRKNIAGTDGATYRNLKYLTPIQTEITAIAADITAAARPNDLDNANELDLIQTLNEQLTQATHALTTTPLTAQSDPIATHPRTPRNHPWPPSLPTRPRRRPPPSHRRRRHPPGTLRLHLHLADPDPRHLHLRPLPPVPAPSSAPSSGSCWDDMRSSAAREYRTPVTTKGDTEFRELAGYFNGLARELADLYRGLEEKVIARSRELVRSERLASVGFLAAGVAHEINNPLSIVSGYAELAEKDLRSVLNGPCADRTASETDVEAEAHALSRVLEAQQIIHEEAFRCKEITSRLLSLARGGTDDAARKPSSSTMSPARSPPSSKASKTIATAKSSSISPPSPNWKCSPTPPK